MSLDWMDHAACRGMAPTDGKSEHLWFPPRGGKSLPAREVCARCPVQAHCRHYGLHHRVSGIWGGLPQEERRQWRRRQRRTA